MKFKTIIKIDSIIFLVGFIMVLFGLLFEIEKNGTFLGLDYKTLQNVLISVGCSIIASTIISFLTMLYLNDDKEARRIIDDWGLKNIEIRSILNYEINERLELMEEGMDIIAFGMKNFLAAKKTLLERKIQRGSTLRILTIDPNSQYVLQREKEENEPEGQIKNSIINLITWAQEVKKSNPKAKGSIMVKKYDSLPQDMYQRIDKYVYVGPLHYGKPSQQTITYEYKPGSKGAEYYANYFISLWENETFCKNVV